MIWENLKEILYRKWGIVDLVYESMDEKYYEKVNFYIDKKFLELPSLDYEQTYFKEIEKYIKEKKIKKIDLYDGELTLRKIWYESFLELIKIIWNNWVKYKLSDKDFIKFIDLADKNWIKSLFINHNNIKYSNLLDVLKNVDFTNLKNITCHLGSLDLLSKNEISEIFNLSLRKNINIDIWSIECCSIEVKLIAINYFIKSWSTILDLKDWYLWEHLDKKEIFQIIWIIWKSKIKSLNLFWNELSSILASEEDIIEFVQKLWKSRITILYLDIEEFIKKYDINFQVKIRKEASKNWIKIINY